MVLNLGSLHDMSSQLILALYGYFITSSSSCFILHANNDPFCSLYVSPFKKLITAWVFFLVTSTFCFLFLYPHASDIIFSTLLLVTLPVQPAFFSLPSGRHLLIMGIKISQSVICIVINDTKRLSGASGYCFTVMNLSHKITSG